MMKAVSTIAVLALFASAGSLLSDDVAEEPAQAAAVAAEQIDQWIVELGDARFATRRAATDALVQIGEPAVEPVVRAALDGSAEVAVRCVQILRRLHDSPEVSVKEAAEAGLRTLAESDNALVNERAMAALDESPLNPNPVPQAGAIQIRMQGGAFVGGGVSVRTTVTNGERTVNVTENDRKIEIRDRDGEDIEIEVTETVNGDEETTEYSADDLDDLKQNHPEIAELYEKYTQQNGLVQFQVFAGQMQQIQAIPRRAIRAPFGPNLPARPEGENQNQQMAEDISSAIERLESVSAALQQLRDSEDADKDALEELVQELDSVLDELAEAKDRLDE